MRKDGSSERAIFIIDKDGIIRYIDIHAIDDQPDNEVLLNELKKIIPDAEKKIEHLYKEEDILESKVVMYCTPWCPDCRLARDWLQEHKINFSEVDISVNLAAARRVRSWGAGSQITPTFNINGEIILDFDKGKLKDLLFDSNDSSS